MKYYAVHFTLAPNTEAARDILACLCGEIGFESFEDSKSGLNGYIQHATYDETRLGQVIQDFPMTDVQIAYQTELMEEHNWNAAWEEDLTRLTSYRLPSRPLSQISPSTIPRCSEIQKLR